MKARARRGSHSNGCLFVLGTPRTKSPSPSCLPVGANVATSLKGHEDGIGFRKFSWSWFLHKTRDLPLPARSAAFWKLAGDLVWVHGIRHPAGRHPSWRNAFTTISGHTA